MNNQLLLRRVFSTLCTDTREKLAKHELMKLVHTDDVTGEKDQRI